MNPFPIPPRRSLSITPPSLLETQINRARDLLVFTRKVVPCWPKVSEILETYIFSLPFWDSLPYSDKYKLQEDLHDLMYCFECGCSWEYDYSVISPGIWWGGGAADPEDYLYRKTVDLYEAHESLFDYYLSDEEF